MSILSTRPGGSAEPLVAALSQAGHRVHAVPTVALAPVEPGGPLDQVASQLYRHDWIVVTSAAGATAMLGAVRRAGAAEATAPDRAAPKRAGESPRWAAVGHATAAVLEAVGIRVSVLPVVSRGAAITAALLEAGSLDGSRVMLPRSDRADEALPRALRAAGAIVDEVVAYRTVEGPPGNEAALRHALADDDLQAIVLCSGSAVRGLVALSAATDGAKTVSPHRRLTAIPLVSIGPSTSTAIREAGLQVTVEASRQSVDGLVGAVQKLLTKHDPSSQRAPQEVLR